MKFLKPLGITFAVLLLIPVLSLASYFVVGVLPHLKAINQMVATELDPPAALYQLAVLSESKEGIARYAGTLLGHRYSQGSQSALFYWSWVVPHIYSEQELFKLWVRLAPCAYRQPPGLRAAAHHLYGKELQALNTHQLAELVVAVKGPSAFQPGSERSNKKVQLLLAQAAAANKSFKPTK